MELVLACSNCYPQTIKLSECRPPFTHVQLPEIYTTVPAVAMAKSNTVVSEERWSKQKAVGYSCITSATNLQLFKILAL